MNKNDLVISDQKQYKIVMCFDVVINYLNKFTIYNLYLHDRTL